LCLILSWKWQIKLRWSNFHCLLKVKYIKCCEMYDYWIFFQFDEFSIVCCKRKIQNFLNIQLNFLLGEKRKWRGGWNLFTNTYIINTIMWGLNVCTFLKYTFFLFSVLPVKILIYLTMKTNSFLFTYSLVFRLRCE
jgi:hypothetical protein